MKNNLICFSTGQNKISWDSMKEANFGWEILNENMFRSNVILFTMMKLKMHFDMIPIDWDDKVEKISTKAWFEVWNEMKWGIKNLNWAFLHFHLYTII